MTDINQHTETEQENTDKNHWTEIEDEMTDISRKTGTVNRRAETAREPENREAKIRTGNGDQVRENTDPIKTALTGTEINIEGSKMDSIEAHNEETKAHPHTDTRTDVKPTKEAGRHHGNELADKTGTIILEPEMKANPMLTGDDPLVAMHLRGTETPGPGTKKEIEEGHQEHGTATNHETGETGIMDHIQEMGQAKATAPTKNPKNTDTETYPQIQVTCSRK